VKTIKLGQDLHASQVTVVVQLDGSVPQPAQRIATERYVGWVRQLQAKHPGAAIHACYEAGPCGYWLHRALVAVGVRSYVVAPVALNGRRKTDGRDAAALCEQLDRYVAGNTRAFSVVAVPSETIERERALVRHRGALGKSLRRVTSQGRSYLLQQGVRVRGAWWSKRAWEALAIELAEWLRSLLEDFRAQAQQLQAQLKAVHERILALAEAKQIRAPRGIGVLTWLTLLLEVGDWSRFQNRRQVGSYSGLCPGECSSGERRREGSIDKRGNRRMRHALQEAVWRLLRWQPDYPPIVRVKAASGARARNARP
jgi:transposase